MNLQKPAIKYIALVTIAVAVIVAVVVIFKNKTTNQGAAINSIPLACSQTNLTPMVEVSSPNGGESFTSGQQITVKWRSCNVPASPTPVSISLFSFSNGQFGTYSQILSMATKNDGAEIVTLPIGAPAGTYVIQLDIDISTLVVVKIGDRSDNTFKINSPQTACAYNAGLDSTTPVAQFIQVDDNIVTANELFVKIKLTAPATCSVMVNKLTVGVGGTAGNFISQLFNTFEAVDANGNQLASVVAASGAQLQNLGINIPAGQSVSMGLRADIKPWAGGIHTASLIATAMTATNANNGNVATTINTPLSGNVMTLGLVGANTSLVSKGQNSVVQSGINDDIGTFTFKFNVTAVGGDIYVSKILSKAIAYQIQKSGVLVTQGISTNFIPLSSNIYPSGSGLSWVVQDGETGLFQANLVVTLPAAGTAGQYRAVMDGIKWAISDIATPNLQMTISPAYQTVYVNLN